MLRTGNGKRLKVVFENKIYKIEDVAFSYVKSIKAGTMTIDDVPENIKAEVQELLNERT